MNLRLFLTSSSILLLSWMAASYVATLPEADFYSEVQPILQENIESVVSVTDDALELTAQQ